MKGELEHELRCRCDTQLAVGERRQHLEVLFEPLQNLVRIELEVAHDLREGVPLNLREREKDVLIGEQRMIPATRFLNGAIDHTLCGFTNLALCDVEVVHESILLTRRSSNRPRSRQYREARCEPSTTYTFAGTIGTASREGTGGYVVAVSADGRGSLLPLL